MPLPVKVLLKCHPHDVHHHVDLVDGLPGRVGAERANVERGDRGRKHLLCLF